jgi:ferrous iron transport protein B
MITFTLVVMVYVPCIATVAALVREFGWRKALTMALVNVALALFIGGLAYHILSLLWF